MDKVTLIAVDNVQLTIEIVDTPIKFCYFALVTDGKVILSGETTIEELLEKYSSVYKNLCEGNLKTFEFKGRKLTSIISIMGPHATIALSILDDSTIKLFWINAEGELSEMMTITMSQFSQLVDNMRRLQEVWSK